MIKPQDKILITGCGGMLGEAVYHHFKDKAKVIATDIDLNESWLKNLDVRSQSEVKKILIKTEPDYIIHLAALTDMEYCEQNSDDAYSTNEQGVRNFIPYVKKNKIPFVYISTAGIFDGLKTGYDESDIPGPLSVYGKSKYAGEIVAKSIPTHIVVRAGWMIGGGPKKDKKFIQKIIKQIRAGKKEISVVNDKFGAPCYTYDLARTISYLLDRKSYGLYHGVCDGEVNRYDVAVSLLEFLGYDKKVKLSEVDSDYFKEDYFAPRPSSEVLLNAKIKRMDPSLVRDWRVCLKEYVQKFDWGL